MLNQDRSPIARCALLRKSPTGRIETLLLQRSFSQVFMAGRWEIPGGSIEAVDKSAADAAIRETWEETGLVVSKLRFILFEAERPGTPKKYLFATSHFSGQIQLCAEHDEYRWLDICQHQSLDITGPSMRLLQHIYQESLSRSPS